MIDPSEENLFRWKLHQVCKLLPIQQEVNQPRHIADTDLVSGVTNRYWAWVSWFSPAWRGTSWWAATPGPAPAISYPETTPSATPAAVHGPYLATVQGVTIYPYDHAPYSLSRVDSKGQVFMLLHQHTLLGSLQTLDITITLNIETFFPLLIPLSSIVSGAARLIILPRRVPSSIFS